MNLESEIIAAVRSGISHAISEKLGGYNSPLDKLLQAAIDQQSSDIKSLMSSAISAALVDTSFRETIVAAVRKKLADLLIQKFGGEMEKQVNAFKSDPSTRARITVAIDEIIQSQMKA